jgi:hypothetical protein
VSLNNHHDKHRALVPARVHGMSVVERGPYHRAGASHDKTPGTSVVKRGLFRRAKRAPAKKANRDEHRGPCIYETPIARMLSLSEMRPWPVAYRINDAPCPSECCRRDVVEEVAWSHGHAKVVMVHAGGIISV